ncbi:hypothetical protein PoB_005228300, partial [Plakobranchus ocellatus]
MPAYLTLLSEKQPRLKVHGEDDDGVLLVSLLIDDGHSTLDVAQDLIKIGMATENTKKSDSEAPQAVASV